VRFLAKLLVGGFLFSSIQDIGRPIQQLAMFSSPPYALAFVTLMAILFAISPPTLALALIIINIGAQMSAAPALAVFVVIFLLCVMFFYARLAPKECLLILAAYFAYSLKIPYVIPLIAGLYFGLSSVVPVTIGVFIWNFIPVVKELLTLDESAPAEALELPAVFSGTLIALLDNVKANETWVFTSFIFALIIIVVFAISRLSIDYAKEMAIAVGAAANIVCFIMVVVVADLDVSIISMTISTVVSAVCVFIIRFFDVALDYQRAEKVQFEDDNNYYIVKVIPKVALTRKRRVVRRIQNSPRE
jgi:hypothetical protein